jgi:zinc transport system substrate-binding protein
MQKIIHFSFILIVSFVILSYPTTVFASSGKIPVFVSIAPQSYLVKQIGGQCVDVQTLISPGQEPHVFAPTPRQVVSLGDARIFFKIGMSFEESLLAKITYSQESLQIIDMAEGVAYRMMTGTHDHDHGENENSKDPHVWLGVSQLKQMAVNVKDALESVDPGNMNYYDQRLQSFLHELGSVHQRAKQKLAPFEGEKLYVFHPAFGYFADTYGLVQKPVEIEGKSPSPRQLAALIGQARKEGVKVVFVQPQFDPKSAGTVAKAIGGTVVAMDSLAENILKNIEEMADKVAAGLGQKGVE